MKNIKYAILACIMLMPLAQLMAQTPKGALIINKFSTSDNGQYVELMVVPSSRDTTVEVDISNWIVDDNNGVFNNPQKAADSLGISTGYLKFADDSMWQNVPIAKLIVLFDASHYDNTLSPYFANAVSSPSGIALDGEGNYFVAIGITPHMVYNESVPNMAGSRYVYGVTSTNSAWKAIELNKGCEGDGIQVRCPGSNTNWSKEPEFYHGLSYGTKTVMITNGDYYLGIHKAVDANCGNNRTLYASALYDDGLFRFSSPMYWRIAAASNAGVIPGVPNNSGNESFRDFVAAGYVHVEACPIVTPDTPVASITITDSALVAMSSDIGTLHNAGLDSAYSKLLTFRSKRILETGDFKCTKNEIFDSLSRYLDSFVITQVRIDTFTYSPYLLEIQNAFNYYVNVEGHINDSLIMQKYFYDTLLSNAMVISNNIKNTIYDSSISALAKIAILDDLIDTTLKNVSSTKEKMALVASIGIVKSSYTYWANTSNVLKWNNTFGIDLSPSAQIIGDGSRADWVGAMMGVQMAWDGGVRNSLQLIRYGLNEALYESALMRAYYVPASVFSIEH